jgi:GrpB-like predicted nucleotidyltransferase (UPF0157 family)
VSDEWTDPRWVDEAIHLSDYDPAWPRAFETEAAALRSLLEEWITGGIHHVGSTAVPGMIAKPVIDIMIGVSSLENSRPCIEVLREAGWWYAPYRPDTMHWFCRPSPAHRTHHLHLVPTGSDWYQAELAFRDHLRAHPVDADRYARLKQDLARRFPNDREAYTEGKSAFIARITARAGKHRHSGH